MAKAMGSMARAWAAVLLAAATHVAPAQESVIYSFQPGNSDGQNPNGGVAVDKAGNIYGATADGGAHISGVVYELSPPSQAGGDWIESIIFNFGDVPALGGSPGITGGGATVILDEKGNLYGTALGGISPGNGQLSAGLVYELSPPSSGSGDWSAQAIYTFVSDDSQPTLLTGPNGAVAFDKKGNLYGIAYGGGAYSNGGVFELSPPAEAGGEWTMTTLYSFNNSSTAEQPWGPGANASLIADAKGNLYGTTQFGGAKSSGTVYELSPPASGTGNWTPAILHSFKEDVPKDGYGPLGSLAMDALGNLYGTTGAQGSLAGGIVFELSPPASQGGQWTETILKNFTAFSKTDGSSPFANVVFDKQGNLWVATYYGGPNYTVDSANSDGVLFEMIPQAGGTWAEALPYPYFFGSQDNDARHPNQPIIIDGKGNIYSTASGGANTCNGSGTCGAVWEYTPPAPVITVSFLPKSGVYAEAQIASIFDSLPGSVIYYTTDGKAPTTASYLYKGAINVTRNTTIRAIAVHDTDTSALTSAYYVIQAAKPAITPVSGTYSVAQQVAIRDATPGAVIHYTTNGIVATAASPVYSKAFKVAAKETVSAIAIATGYGTSPAAEANFVIEKPAATPVISPNGGTVAKGAKVSIKDATTGAVIYYTTNGIAPTAKSTKYTTAITVSANQTIKAIAVASGYTNSAAASATFTIK